jgi:hypothetical protein
MDFTLRPASTGWEALPLVPGTAIGMWVWCRPLHAPLDLIVRVPVETFQAVGGMLSLRQIIAGAGAELGQVHGLTIQGTFIDALGGTNPLLDHAVPAASPWVEVAIRMLVPASYAALPPAAPVYSAPAPSGAGLSAESQTSAMAIQADWLAVEQAETNLMALRKQLATVQGRLLSLNRDLSADENVASDNADRKDWQDARRWLRDCAGIASRYIKEADTGVTSMAGNKRRMEQLVEQAKAGRLSPQQMAAAQNEIEAHRKTVVNIQNQMQHALQSASRDGEQRAQQVLTRIAAKVRAHRTKR